MKARRPANSPPPLPPEQVREQLLRDVESAWIEGVLQRSPYQDLLHTLDQTSRPEALAHPWHFQLQETDTPPTLLPSGTSTRELYDQSASSLLLLGQPGAGKTTVLLTLAHDLLARARFNAQQPIPVVFNLSTWTTQRRTLDGWLFDELATKYHIERHYARPWLRADLLVLLLDGLDELAQEARTSCIEAINVYYREHPSVQLVVCSREDEYLAQPARLDVRYTAQIQPLNNSQVERYFEQGQCENVRQAWLMDAGLQALMRSPLLLTITLLTYHDADSSDALPIAIPPQEQREQIFAAYAERLLRLAGDTKLYADQPMRRWLSWIARQMQVHSQSMFCLEDMQPDWLPTVALRRSYSILFGLVVGLPFVVPISLLIGGIKGVGYGLGIGLVICWLAGMFVASRSEVKLVDNMISLLRALRKNILVWLLGALLVSVLGITVGGLPYGLVIMLLYALLVWVVVGPSDGATGAQAKPGWRIWRSGQNGLAIGLLATLGIGLLGVPFSALYVGLIIGLLAGLFAGGAACIRYILLRFLLSRPKNNYIPRDLSAFLDHLAEHSLLYKVGSGYMFPHRFLQDYFSSLDSLHVGDSLVHPGELSSRHREMKTDEQMDLTNVSVED